MKNKLFKLLFLILNFSSMNMQAQNTERTFDFWIGNWNAYWQDSLKGINEISMKLKDRVVEENFSSIDGTFNGRSWSVFDSVSNSWRQTWVDDAGAYLTFTGGSVDDEVILNMNDARVKDGKSVFMRMVFSDIKPNSFEWQWQRSEDKTNWNSIWTILYKRR